MWTGVVTGEVGVPGRAGWWARYAFTNRPGGASSGPYASMNLADHVGDEPDAVRANRDRLASALGGRFEDGQPGRTTPRLVVMAARHGSAVAFADETSGSTAAGVDGLVTASPDVGVAALAADCVPLVLADVEAGVVGAAHCGWRGLVAGIVDRTIDSMLTQGARVRDITAIAGPAICGRCYGVPTERAQLACRFAPESAAQSRQGGPALDVRLGVLGQLGRRGVRATTIGGCTFEDTRFYSHRRDGVTGRHGAAIVLRAGANGRAPAGRAADTTRGSGSR